MQEAACLEQQLDLFTICGEPVVFDSHGSSSGRTSPEPSRLTREMTFEPCSKKSDRPQFQCLKVENGQTQGWQNCRSAKLHGVSLTLNTMYHSDVSVSFLSQILEPENDVPEKYYLSAKSCLGILRRAEQRGKELPPELKAALEIQSYDYAQESRGCGKGALISKEKSLCLKSDNDQVLFVPDKARSLTARNDGSPCIDRGPEVIAFEPGAASRVGGHCYSDGKSPTLRAEPGDNGVTIAAGFKAGAGADAGGLGYQVEQMPTLTSAESGTQRPTVAVYGVGVDNGKAGTLDASYYKGQGERHGTERTAVAVFDMTHADEVMRKVPDGRIPTLNARMGTGGNQVPVASYAIAGNTIDRQLQNGGNGKGVLEEKSYTLNTVDRHAVFTQQAFGQYENTGKASALKARDYKDATDLIAAVDCRNGREQDINGTLQAKPNGGTSLNLNNVVRQQKTVRRLTPLEAERLQVLPDGYTLIDDKTCSDTARYKALGNGMAQPCADYVIRRIVEVTT